MRKVFINKWFLLAASLTLGLSTASFISYKKAEAVCNLTSECPAGTGTATESNEMLWDLISRQFTPLIAVY